MKNSTAQTEPTVTEPTATEMEAIEAEPEKVQQVDNMQLWVDLQAEMHNAKTTQDYNDAVRKSDAVEAAIAAEQRDKEWQTDLAEAEAQDAESVRDGELPTHKLGVIEAAVDRARASEEWLWAKLDEIKHSEGAQNCDAAIRKMAAINAEIGRVLARQAELSELRRAVKDAADDYEPNANYDPDDEAL